MELLREFCLSCSSSRSIRASNSDSQAPQFSPAQVAVGGGAGSPRARIKGALATLTLVRSRGTGSDPIPRRSVGLHRSIEFVDDPSIAPRCTLASAHHLIVMADAFSETHSQQGRADARLDEIFDEALQKNIQRNRETLRSLGFEPAGAEKHEQ